MCDSVVWFELECLLVWILECDGVIVGLVIGVGLDDEVGCVGVVSCWCFLVWCLIGMEVFGFVNVDVSEYFVCGVVGFGV